MSDCQGKKKIHLVFDEDVANMIGKQSCDPIPENTEIVDAKLDGKDYKLRVPKDKVCEVLEKPSLATFLKYLPENASACKTADGQGIADNFLPADPNEDADTALWDVNAFDDVEPAAASSVEARNIATMLLVYEYLNKGDEAYLVTNIPHELLKVKNEAAELYDILSTAGAIGFTKSGRAIFVVSDDPKMKFAEIKPSASLIRTIFECGKNIVLFRISDTEEADPAVISEIKLSELINYGATVYDSATSKELAATIKTMHEMIEGEVAARKPEEELALKLKPHQEAALEALRTYKGSKHMLCRVVCGGGKTLIASHYLRETQPKFLIAIAPLISSVHQLAERVMAFIPDYSALMICSKGSDDLEKAGVKVTTDAAEIRKFIKASKKSCLNHVIFATFKSATDILTNFADVIPLEFILVDEVHRTWQKEKLCTFINMFKRGLYLTFTPQKYLSAMLNMEPVYTYDVKDAIKDKVICPYQILVPELKDGQVLARCDIEQIFPDIELNSETKAFYDILQYCIFAVDAMLKYGPRRCIVYLNDIDECNVFSKIMKEHIAKKYNINIDAYVVTADVSSNARNRIFQEFGEDRAVADIDEQSKFDEVKRKFDENLLPGKLTLKFIASVKIMNEAIDLPSCDSTFVVADTDLTILTGIQRLMRGSRIDKSNPHKINYHLLWAANSDLLAQYLEILRETGIDIPCQFRKKAKPRARKPKEKKEEIEIGNDIDVEAVESVDCVSLEKKWKRMYDRIAKMNGAPKPGSKEHAWLEQQRAWAEQGILPKEHRKLLADYL